MTPTTTLNPYTLVPDFVSRLLLIGENREPFDQRLQAGIEEVWTARHLPLAPGQAKENYFDCILVTHISELVKDIAPILSSAHTLLNENGIISIYFSHASLNGCKTNDIDDLLIKGGFLSYKLHLEMDNGGSPFGSGLVAVRHSYNPIEHARQLTGQGRFDNAIDILEGIPDALVGNMEVLSYIAAEKQRIFLKWQHSLPEEEPRNRFFFRSQRELAQITATLAEYTPAYWVHSDFWRHIGHNDMAARILRSILHVDVNPQTQARLLDIPAETQKVTVEQSPHVWSGTRPLPRLLILTHDNSDYGMDTLYDGLCEILGKENVVEYPWKPTLHGHGQQETKNYPCLFNYESRPMPVNDIISELKQNRFDVIIFADVVQMAYSKEVRLFLEAGKHLPVVLYDTWDNSYTPLKAILDYLGRKSVDLCFKREMLQGLDYGPRVFPLPFGYPDSRIPYGPANATRQVDIFWAGKRVWGLRPLYISRIEEYLDQKFDQTYPQEKYAEQIRSARIGLSFLAVDLIRFATGNCRPMGLCCWPNAPPSGSPITLKMVRPPHFLMTCLNWKKS